MVGIEYGRLSQIIDDSEGERTFQFVEGTHICWPPAVKKKKRVMDNSVVIAGGGRTGIRGLNGNGKKYNKDFKK